MATITTDKTTNSEPINVFLIGNNPIELSNIYEMLKAFKARTYNTEIGFDLKDTLKRISKFNPSCILIDDNMEKISMKKLIKRLSSNDKTKDIPITVLKNSNYYEAGVDAQEFVLKDGVTGETLSRSLLNSMRIKRMHAFIYRTYKKRKKQIKNWLN